MNMTTFISIFIFTFTFLKVKHGPSPPRRFIKLIIVTFTFLLLTFTFQLRKINKRPTSGKEARLCFLRGRLLFRSQVLCNLIFLLNCAIHVITHRKDTARLTVGIWWNRVFLSGILTFRLIQRIPPWTRWNKENWFVLISNDMFAAKFQTWRKTCPPKWELVDCPTSTKLLYILISRHSRVPCSWLPNSTDILYICLFLNVNR